MERTFCNYFANLFTTTNPSQAQIDDELKDMPIKVTREMNEELDRPFTVEEIIATLSQMCPTKAPGPGGFPAAFSQKYWDAVSKGLLTTCLYILNEGGNVALLNHAYIALIPKIEKPRHDRI